MTGLWQTPLPGLLLTLGAYVVFQRIGALTKGHPLSNPVPWSILGIALLLRLAAVPYETYFGSAKVLHFLLGPATVALAVPLAQELPRMRRLVFRCSAACWRATSPPSSQPSPWPASSEPPPCCCAPSHPNP